MNMTNLGMLWRSDTKHHPLKKRLNQAIRYYKRKYHKSPNLVYINPDDVTGDTPTIRGVTIKFDEELAPNHFWIGVSS